MGIRKVERGPTSGRVSTNVRALREAVGLSLEGLSEAMGRAGRPILPSGLSKIEQGDRRVDVDDLIALAVALGVNSSRLLLPDAAGEEPIELTATVDRPAWAVWQWADGYAPLPTRSGDDEDDPWNTPEELENFERLARPASLRRTQQHPAMRAAVEVAARVRRVVHHATKEPDRSRRRKDLGLVVTFAAARRALDRLSSELEDIEEAHRGDR